ncbi:MAG: DUF3883 domain-containing protein [Candidatus Korarchaeota archaeon]|nr:DUF3883 domain-containing protein [Candidatus Korarchaeota archaeon]
MPTHPRVVSYYTRAGYKLELIVMEVIEESLAILGLTDVRLTRVHSGAPYDIELIVGDRRAFIEVKGASDEDRLQWKVNQAFKREHPEPFCVIGVLGYPKDPALLLKKLVPTWIWIKPGREGKLGRFSPNNLRRWLKIGSMI